MKEAIDIVEQGYRETMAYPASADGRGTWICLPEPADLPRELWILGYSLVGFPEGRL